MKREKAETVVHLYQMTLLQIPVIFHIRKKKGIFTQVFLLRNTEHCIFTVVRQRRSPFSCYLDLLLHSQMFQLTIDDYSTDALTHSFTSQFS